jgi:hypothetical protein
MTVPFKPQNVSGVVPALFPFSGLMADTSSSRRLLMRTSTAMSFFD